MPPLYYHIVWNIGQTPVHLYQEKGLSDIAAETYLLFVSQIGLAET